MAISSVSEDKARQTAEWLLTPEAVRAQCALLFDAAKNDRLAHFSLHLDRLPGAAALVATVTKEAYPDLAVPFHARWRHFVFSGEDRAAPLFAGLANDPLERARAKTELAITSVLLDAGAGPDWSYRDSLSGNRIARSEGLALASLDLFAAGGFSADPARPLRADALKGFSHQRLAGAFHVDASNPLEGLEGRAGLIARLGEAVEDAPQWFGKDAPRLGNLVDALVERAAGGTLPAREILIALLYALGSIWTGRPHMDGLSLGDCWRHPQAGETGLVPFHKLSQWLAYSLVEPLQELGFKITEPDALTGLAEYRNGGLFLDTGVIALKDSDAAQVAWSPESELVVEWRALTVCLLDRIAPLVRQELGVQEEDLPLAAVLEGGTWAAGRRIAKTIRPGGGPPLTIVSDGSVF